MNVLVAITTLVLALIGVSHGQYNGRVRNIYPMNNMPRDVTYGCTYEELSSLIAIVRALEDKECYTAPVQNGSNFNAEELVMNLVNALIQITSQALNQKHCHCPHSGTTINPTHNNGGSHYSHADGGLIDLDLLNPNKKDNILDIDIAKQHLLGLGLGGGGQNVPASDSMGYNKGNEYTNSNGRSANGEKTDEGLIKVDLLNTNKKNNVAEVDLVRQHVLGVALGDGGERTASQAAPVASNNEDPPKPDSEGGIKNLTNIDESLVNLDALNSNKQNKVAELDLAKQTVLGVGLGNTNESM